MAKTMDMDRLDRLVAQARSFSEERERGYRARALKLYPWICTRCSREFVRENITELTVHHRDHDHDNNPADGSNWELLCLYCHDNEHRRQIEAGNNFMAKADAKGATHNPFAGLGSLLKKSE